MGGVRNATMSEVAILIVAKNAWTNSQSQGENAPFMWSKNNGVFNPYVHSDEKTDFGAMEHFKTMGCENG